MRRLVVTATLLALASPAQAWKHTGAVWDPGADFPIPYLTNDDPTGPECLVGAPAGQCALATDEAFSRWATAGCTDFDGVDGGFADLEDLDLGDGVNGITFGADLEPGVLGITALDVSGFAFELDGRAYYHAVESDIAIAADGPWASPAEIAAGTCADAFDVATVVGHELGHLAGLGHSCDNGEPCADPALSGALMNWTAPVCAALPPGEDDLAGLEALYGPGASFACGTGESPILGVAPVTLNCAVSSSSSIDEASWLFGDGGTDSGTAVTHTWEEEGLYSVRVAVSGSDPACGTWERDLERLGYVRVCDEPRAQFSMDHKVGRVYEVKNKTPIDVVGCITEVKWAVYEGNEITDKPHEVLEYWDFDYEFPEDGRWTVVLNVGGPAGTTASVVSLDVRAHAGINPFGCSSAAGGVAGSWWLLALIGLRRRR